MDRRILLLAAIFLIIASSILVYRKCFAATNKAYVSFAFPVNLKPGEKATYQDNTAGAAKWKWDFGDGEYGNTQSGSHSYLDAGNYNVRLTLIGDFGILKDTSKIITVHSDQPVIAASQVTPPVVPAEVKKPEPVPHVTTAPKATHKPHHGGQNEELPDAHRDAELK